MSTDTKTVTLNVEDHNKKMSTQLWEIIIRDLDIFIGNTVQDVKHHVKSTHKVTWTMEVLDTKVSYLWFNVTKYLKRYELKVEWVESDDNYDVRGVV